MFTYLGLILVLFSWASGAYLITTWRGTRAMSLSLHAASNKNAAKLFAVVLVGFGLLFYYWLVHWFVPHLDMSGMFIALLTVAFACQCIAGIVADAKGWRHVVHIYAAYTMAFLYLPLSLLILASDISTLARMLGCICLAWMITTLMLFCFVKRARPHYLLFQSSYIVAFQLVILFAAYIP